MIRPTHAFVPHSSQQIQLPVVPVVLCLRKGGTRREHTCPHPKDYAQPHCSVASLNVLRAAIFDQILDYMILVAPLRQSVGVAVPRRAILMGPLNDMQMSLSGRPMTYPVIPLYATAAQPL